MKSLDSEYNVGIETFLTKNIGTGGKLRTIPEDFCVIENSKNLPISKDGNFTIAKITSINWETNLLVREISKKLCISRKRISFAGTKDKRAKTTQLMSFFRVNTEKLKNIKINNVNIEDVYRSNIGIKIGDLVGNKFQIKIRNIKENANKENLKSIIDEIKNTGGIPNYFGIQRFGIIRPITHLVGRCIVNNNFKDAVMTYLTNPFDEEDEYSFDVRKKLEKTNDFTEALNTFPNELNYEKSMLNILVHDSNNFIKAIQELPFNLITMFIYAYQSYVFNKILSKRILNNIPLNIAIIGDIILPIVNNNILDQEIHVNNFNIEKVNKQIKRGKAVVSGLIVGYNSSFSKGEMGEIEHRIIDEEKINTNDFIIPDIPNLSSSGKRRALIAPISDIDFSIKNDDLFTNSKMLNISFDLLKGCYATSFLREIMKSDDIRSY